MSMRKTCVVRCDLWGRAESTVRVCVRPWGVANPATATPNRTLPDYVMGNLVFRKAGNGDFFRIPSSPPGRGKPLVS